MKKGLLLIVICSLGLAMQAQAQWTLSYPNLTTTNNVVIGSTATTGYPLSLSWTTGNTKLAIWEGWGTSYGFGIQSNQFRLHLGGSADRFSFLNAPNGTELVTIRGTGQVLIGTTCALPAGGLLGVNGTIYATAVNVSLAPGGCFPDYVFEEGYNLNSLKEVEKYIKKNKHLPEVPSANEVEKDGINVAEMDAILLKKIEELTLYVIDLEKKVAGLQASIK